MGELGNALQTNAAVLVAIISGIFGLCAVLGNWLNASLAARISRKNAELQARLTANVTLAEFRQKWSDSLREDMAKFLALSVRDNVRDATSESAEELFNVATKIKLRVHSGDKNFKELMSSIEGLTLPSEPQKIGKHVKEYTIICQKILKAEWDVLRDEVRSVCD